MQKKSCRFPGMIWGCCCPTLMQTSHPSLQPRPCGIAQLGHRVPAPTHTCDPPTLTDTTPGLATGKSSPGGWLAVPNTLRDQPVLSGLGVFWGLGWFFPAGKAAGVCGQGRRERTKCSEGVLLLHRQILLREWMCSELSCHHHPALYG